VYDHIAGELVRKDLTEAVVRAAGVGFRVMIPVSTYERLPSNGPVIVYTHLAVRENDMRLYGFATEKERAFFRILIGATGIGPATALAIMSGASIEEFARAVEEEDYDALSRVRGIGKKTARRIVTDLKDAIIAFRQQFLAGVATRDAAARDAVLALQSLGYPRGAAEKAVEKARESHATAGVEELVRVVLSHGGE
jgi:Holliday junction DNA helicase RuvA